MRITDVFLVFPSLILAMAIVAALGPQPLQCDDRGGSRHLACLRPADARPGPVTAGDAFRGGNRSVGAPDQGIIARHLLPNIVSALIVQASFDNRHRLQPAGRRPAGFARPTCTLNGASEEQSNSLVHDSELPPPATHAILLSRDLGTD